MSSCLPADTCTPSDDCCVVRVKCSTWMLQRESVLCPGCCSAARRWVSLLLVLLREFGVSFTKKHPCAIIFTVGASSPQPAVIMWIMCCSWMPARNQIHAPPWLANMLLSWPVSLAGVWLEAHKIAPHAQLSTVRTEGEEFCLGIRDQKDVESDWRRAGGPLWLVFGVDFKKREQTKELLSTRVAYLAPRWAQRQTAAFLSLLLDRLSWAKTPARLNIVHTYRRMDTCRAIGDVWL